MSVMLSFGIFLQIAAILILLIRVGKHWFSHTGVLFVLMVFVFHGLTEIVQLLFPGRNRFRLLVNSHDVASWVYIVSWAILLFSFVYSLVLSKRPVDRATNTDLRLLPGWRLLLAAIVPGYLLSVSTEALGFGYWIGGLLNQFLLIGLVLSSLGFLMQHNRALMIVLLVQSSLIALIGSRLSVIAAVVMLLSTVVRYQIQLGLKRISLILVFVAALIVMISGARATVGRAVFDATASERTYALVSGLVSISSRDVLDHVVDDFVYRFDGNTFPGMLHGRLVRSWEPAGLRALWPNFFLSVPTFMNPTKLSSEDYHRDEEVYMILHYNLPGGIDYLPTTLGIVYGYHGASFLLVVAAIAGWLFAVVDRWMHKQKALLPFLVGNGLAYCIVFMEQGIRMYFVTFRGVVALYVLLWSWQMITGVSRYRTADHEKLYGPSDVNSARTYPRPQT